MLRAVLTPYAPLLDGLTPYFVATEALAARLDPAPLGIEVPAANRFDPTKAGSGPFLDLVERLDTLTFGPLGLGMPRWALYDCGELPGIVFGLGRSADEMRPRVRRGLELPEDYAGLVPLSMFIAIPMLGQDRWHGHSVCSINEVSPGVTRPGLRRLSVALGLACLGARKLRCSTTWSSPRLESFADFAPLELKASFLEANTEPATCVFDVDVDLGRLEAALAIERPAVPADAWVDIYDEAALKALQVEIEAGADWCIAGPPTTKGPEVRIPLTKEVAR